jgi:hypothetical protein
MAVATANPSFVAARRRLFTALFASAGVTLDPSLARRRPGRTGSTEDLAPPSAPDSLSLPREDIRWLTRATFGFTIGDDIAYLALGASDDERRMILSGAPIPQRLVVQLFARRSLAAYRRRLYAVSG